jgi:hypothetical protein
MQSTCRLALVAGSDAAQQVDIDTAQQIDTYVAASRNNFQPTQSTSALPCFLLAPLTRREYDTMLRHLA